MRRVEVNGVLKSPWAGILKQESCNIGAEIYLKKAVKESKV